jgi:hypothetical protein
MTGSYKIPAYRKAADSPGTDWTRALNVSAEAVDRDPSVGKAIAEKIDGCLTGNWPEN